MHYPPATEALPVLVAGAGPAGLMAGLALASRGMPVRIIEKKAQRSIHFKALSINTRTLELLEPLGVSEQFIARGNPIPAVCYRTVRGELFRIDYSRLEHRYNFMVALPQTETEAIMEMRLNEFGVFVERGSELVSFDPAPSHVTAKVMSGNATESIEANYLIGADGAYSVIRRACGIDFPGSVMPHRWSLADVRMTSPWPVEPANILLRPGGMLFALRVRGDTFRLGSNRPGVLDSLPPELEVHEVLWQTEFEVSHRQASSYQSGRVLLAGDAAHVHAPMGARGMNMSIEDSAALVERLVSGRVDDYSRARLMAGAAALRVIKAQTILATGRNPVLRACQQHLVPALLKIPPLNRYLVRSMLGLGAA